MWVAVIQFDQLKAVGLSLKMFQQAENPEDRPEDPYTWPILAWSPDRGSQGVCAINALLHFKVNLDPFFDLNHGAWDDEKNIISDMKEYSWLLMMLVAFNVFEGPWNTAERYSETVHAMQSLHCRVRPQDVPLFMEFSAEIIQA